MGTLLRVPIKHIEKNGQPPILGRNALIFLSGKISFLPYADMNTPNKAPEAISFSGLAVIKGGI